ncbi:hypothetical protein FJT64_015357 [Amphibalanus amphitrite]|uniref:Uncharacterized protein n=1 Tax=Amphibalanus amphitrite TaxID=1232801 RepID=A0A6A4X4I2_AMPAM|nr:hypothetical protein FJT64_015357 [Amphibalanus amphitrite]
MLPMQDSGRAVCRPAAVCAVVQANAWGVSRQQLCRCPGRQRCPLHWDNEDGHSVTHGSSQYKAPALAPCAEGQPAMTDELVTYLDPGTPMEHHEQLHCRCSAGRRLLQTDSQWQELPDGELIRAEHSCVQMPVCRPGQHCKFITRTPQSSLVQVNCACAGRLSCPSATDSQVLRVPIGSGFLVSVLCR